MVRIFAFTAASLVFLGCSSAAEEAERLRKQAEVDSLQAAITAVRSRIDSLRQQNDSLSKVLDSLDIDTTKGAVSDSSAKATP